MTAKKSQEPRSFGPNPMIAVYVQDGEEVAGLYTSPMPGGFVLKSSREDGPTTTFMPNDKAADKIVRIYFPMAVRQAV